MSFIFSVVDSVTTQVTLVFKPKKKKKKCGRGISTKDKGEGWLLLLNPPFLGNLSFVPTAAVTTTSPDVHCCGRFSQQPNLSSHLCLMIPGETTGSCVWPNQLTHGQSLFSLAPFQFYRTHKTKTTTKSCWVALDQTHVSPAREHARPTCRSLSWLLRRAKSVWIL